jgi:hypothetical protein
MTLRLSPGARSNQDFVDLQTLLAGHLGKYPTESTNVITPFGTGVNPLAITSPGGMVTVRINNTGNIYINPTGVATPLVLGPNAIDQKVIGLNADKLDGYNEDYFLTALPTTALRNVIYGPDTVTPLLGLLVYPGTLVNPFLIVDAGLNTLFAVNQYGQVVVSPTTAMPPMVLGGNATGRLVTGLNADLLDGYHASAFALSGAGGVTTHSGLTDLDADDHTQYIFNQPNSSTRNLIQPSDDYIPLVIKSYGLGQSEDHLQVVDATNVPLAGIDANFQLYGIGVNAGNQKISSVANPTAPQDAVTLNYLTGNYKSYTGSTATGTLLVGNGTTFTGLPIGTSGQILSVTGGTAGWTTPNKDGSIWYGFERRPVQSAVTGGAFTLAVADASLQNTNDEDGFTMGRTASDGNITNLAFQFACPYEIDTTQAMTAHVYIRLNGAGANQIEMESTIRVLNDNEHLKDGGTLCTDAKALDLTGYDTDDLVIFPLVNAIPANTITTRQELIKGCIFRDATSANGDDTYTNSCIVVGVMFRYRR